MHHNYSDNIEDYNSIENKVRLIVITLLHVNALNKLKPYTNGFKLVELVEL